LYLHNAGHLLLGLLGLHATISLVS